VNQLNRRSSAHTGPYWAAFLSLFLFLCCASFFPQASEWGFWGHRRINRVAVFSLPPEMIVFFKKNIEFITEHAVDPDKRRYATQFEGPRHFIDIDHWGEYPFPEVPRDWTTALARYTDVLLISPQNDTVQLFGNQVIRWEGRDLEYIGETEKNLFQWPDQGIKKENYVAFFRQYIQPQYYEEAWQLPCELLSEALGITSDCQQIVAVDRFSEYGIVPYYLLQMQSRLTNAFRTKNEKAILRLAAEIGHYIGDAHVPLHTTENYNGQLTNQVGIHAFWESRIPELFADREYDLFVGKAQYIEQPREYFWKVVLDSHRLVDSVLTIERRLSETFPRDQQFCFDERLNQTIRIQCEAYAAAYQEAMQGMVEQRMRDAILSIASSWYTAWVDAGQPDLSDLGEASLTKKETEALKELEEKARSGKILGRAHNQ
jgi:hypothetical protein